MEQELGKEPFNLKYGSLINVYVVSEGSSRSNVAKIIWARPAQASDNVQEA